MIYLAMFIENLIFGLWVVLPSEGWMGGGFSVGCDSVEAVAGFARNYAF